MTKFNPENKATLPYGEALKPAMEITDAADAYNYLQQYIAFTEKRCREGKVDMEGKTAEQICKINLGYFAGYYSEETRERVERLFNCSHPIFGSIAKNGSHDENIISGGSGTAEEIVKLIRNDEICKHDFRMDGEGKWICKFCDYNG